MEEDNSVQNFIYQGR